MDPSVSCYLVFVCYRLGHFCQCLSQRGIFLIKKRKKFYQPDSTLIISLVFCMHISESASQQKRRWTSRIPNGLGHCGFKMSSHAPFEENIDIILNSLNKAGEGVYISKSPVVEMLVALLLPHLWEVCFCLFFVKTAPLLTLRITFLIKLHCIKSFFHGFPLWFWRLEFNTYWTGMLDLEGPVVFWN